MLLDEATSALDSVNEAAVMEAVHDIHRSQAADNDGGLLGFSWWVRGSLRASNPGRSAHPPDTPHTVDADEPLEMRCIDGICQRMLPLAIMLDYLKSSNVNLNVLNLFNQCLMIAIIIFPVGSSGI